MEARKLERQRRDSAKSSAIESLPSTNDQEFNYRLIDLYSQYECLWNTSLREHNDVEMKRLAWEEIAKRLGSHLTASFVRSRIAGLRYRLNLYKLQTIEYKMGPTNVRPPEKLYYIDKFAFLERINSPQPEPAPSTGDRKLEPGPSIATIVKQRMQQQQQHDQLPHVLRGLNEAAPDSGLGIASVVQRRMQNQTQPQPQPQMQMQPASLSVRSSQMHMPKFHASMASARQMLQQVRQQKQRESRSVAERATDKLSDRDEVSQTKLDTMLQDRMHRLHLDRQDKLSQPDSLDSSSDAQNPGLRIPTVIKKRMQKSSLHDLQLPTSHSKSFHALPDSMGGIAHGGATLQAQPGDSVSKTKVTSGKRMPRPKPQSDAQHHSDDDELYRLHWDVRQQPRRSTRAGLNPENRSRLPQAVRMEALPHFNFIQNKDSLHEPDYLNLP